LDVAELPPASSTQCSMVFEHNYPGPQCVEIVFTRYNGFSLGDLFQNFSAVVHFHRPFIERKDAKRFMSTADLGSAFWGMVLVVASTNSITLRIAAPLLLSALVVVLIIAKNIRLRISPSDFPNSAFIHCGIQLTSVYFPILKSSCWWQQHPIKPL